MENISLRNLSVKTYFLTIIIFSIIVALNVHAQSQFIPSKDPFGLKQNSDCTSKNNNARVFQIKTSNKLGLKFENELLVSNNSAHCVPSSPAVPKNSLKANIKEKFSELQNFPNPFNPETKIQFDIRSPAFIKLTIYDITGKEVEILVHTYLQPGRYEERFNGSRLASGVYFCKLEVEGSSTIRRMMLIK